MLLVREKKFSHIFFVYIHPLEFWKNDSLCFAVLSTSHASVLDIGEFYDKTE